MGKRAGWLAALVVRGKGRAAARGAGTQDAAVAAIRKLGGRVERDAEAPGKPVVAVDLYRTPVSDVGLAHLKGLANLETLFLYRTRITDGGLAHLKGLAKLQTLSLSGTEVTDGGLAHLKGLANLRTLYLVVTKVTDKGVADLQKALPEVAIIR
jgi:hypothetical protein